MRPGRAGAGVAVRRPSGWTARRRPGGGPGRRRGRRTGVRPEPRGRFLELHVLRCHSRPRAPRGWAEAGPSPGGADTQASPGRRAHGAGEGRRPQRLRTSRARGPPASGRKTSLQKWHETRGRRRSPSPRDGGGDGRPRGAACAKAPGQERPSAHAGPGPRVALRTVCQHAQTSRFLKWTWAP